MTKMMTKSPKNDFKIKSTRKNQEDSRKDEFKIQEKKSRRLHKGSIEKFFSKNKHSTVLFFKIVFLKIF